MTNNRTSDFEMQVGMPWWVAAVVGLLIYGVLAHIIPAADVASPYLAHIENFRPLAYIVLGLGLLVSALSLVRDALLRRRFQQQEGVEELRHLSWQQFEMIVGEAFRRRGYLMMEHGGGGVDGGVDMVLRKEGRKFYVQCKQWQASKVGVKPIRELFNLMRARDAAGGIFICSGRYTPQAHEFAHQSAVQLIDGAALARMVTEVQTQQPFMEPTVWGSRAHTSIGVAIAAPACPVCGGSMVQRMAKKGPDAGTAYWGCEKFPMCKGTRAV